MRSMIRLIAVASLLAVMSMATSAAPAADAPTPTDSANGLPESRWSDSAEIVVPSGITIPGMKRCPTMWKLRRGNSTLFVMATLTVVPDDMSWDSSCFKKVLAGANHLFLPGGPSSFKPPSFTLPGNRKLENELSRATYERFTATLEREGLPPQFFMYQKPQWVPSFLLGLVYKYHHMHDEAYPADVPGLAKQAQVPVQEITADISSGTIANMRNELDKKQAEACLIGGLDFVDYQIVAAPRMAEAWGRGDMAAVLRDFREMPKGKCMPPGRIAEADAYDATLIDAFARPLDDALNQPGKSVAVLSLDLVLLKGGILDHLKAKSVDVIAPAGAEDTE